MTTSVRPEWVPRWRSLQSDDVTRLHITSAEALKQWTALNELMSTDPMTVTDLIPLSSVLDTIDMMKPVNDDYLLYVYIDEQLNHDARRRAYHNLGRVIRERGIRWPYADSVVAINLGLHHNCRLAFDPVYGIRVQIGSSDITAPFSSYPSWLQTTLLEYDQLNVLTGIVHTGWRTELHDLTVYQQVLPPVESRPEIDWLMIRWNDVLSMASAGYVYTDADLLLVADLMFGGERGYSPHSRHSAQSLPLVVDSRLDIYNSNLAINTKEESVRHLLAGYGSRYAFDLSSTAITLNIDQRGYCTLDIPHMGQMINRIIHWSDNVDREFLTGCVEMIIHQPNEIVATRSTQSLRFSLELIILILARNGRVPAQLGMTGSPRSVSFPNYSSIAERIASTLGGNFCLTLANSSLSKLEVEDGVDLENLTGSLLYSGERSSTPDFTRWPRIPNV